MDHPIPQSPDEARELLERLYGDPHADPMSPYERVETAIALREPDRVPFDFWAVPEMLQRLRAYLRAKDHEEVLRLLGVDCRLVAPDYIGPKPRTLDDGTFCDVWGSHRRLVSNEYSTYEEYATFPLAEAQNVAEVETWDGWPHTEYWDWDGVLPKIKTLNADVRYHVRYEVGGIFEFAWGLYGLQKFLEDLIQKPEVPCAIMDCYTELFIANVRNLLEAATGQIDMLYTYDDVAMQNGLLMSPEMWRRFILPRHKRLNAVIKRSGVKVMYHCCGAIFPLIGAFVDEMGIDVLNPLQPRAAGIDMLRIKREFGSRLAFHGGIDLQHTLPYGSPIDVRAEVRDRCRVLGRGGGYICSSAHFIQADIPAENIIAMYTASRTTDDVA